MSQTSTITRSTVQRQGSAAVHAVVSRALDLAGKGIDERLGADAVRRAASEPVIREALSQLVAGLSRNPSVDVPGIKAARMVRAALEHAAAAA